jgi:hypothetical protein
MQSPLPPLPDDARQHPFHLRYRQRALFAREVEASSEIDAPRDAVWEVLVDFDAYPEWNPFTRRVSTTLEVGAPVSMHVDMPGRSARDRVEWVNLVEPGRTICWGMHIGHPGLLTANRWQRLHDLVGGRTRYHTVDRFSGLLVPLVMAFYGEPTRQGFASVAEGLKARVEERAASGSGAAAAAPQTGLEGVGS